MPGWAQKIKKRLDEMGKKPTNLAMGIGVNDNRVSHWLSKGVGEPGPGQILAISRYLRLPVEYLCDDTMDVPPVDRTPDDEHILKTAHALGYDEAIKRLTIAQVRVQDLPVARPPMGT